MNKNLFFILCMISTLIFSSASICLSDQTQSTPAVVKKEEGLTYEEFNRIIGGVKGYKQIEADVRYDIVQRLIEVKNGPKKGGISAEDFFKQVSAYDMPNGQDLRYVLMGLKSDIGKHLGIDGLQRVFGEQYPQSQGGGSHVEEIILTHRKKVVQTGVTDAIKLVAATNPKFSAFYSEVGSWSTESSKQMKLAGDIDFNFLCGDMATALALKKAFDDSIVKRYGRTPEDLDIPCTVHGSATGEVYVGLHGQKFVEGEMKNRKVKKINFGDNGKPIGIDEGKGLDFEEARNIMLLEAELSKTPLPDVEGSRWKTQPGIILEMIRHFEHDIVKQNVYTELESFVKAAKFLERHYKSLIEAAGEGAVKNKKLHEFSKKLVEHKNSPRKQAEIIKNYFEATNRPLPFEADLATNKSGKSKSTIKANNKVIGEFWGQCRKTMWETANNEIKKMEMDIRKKAKALGKADVAGAERLYEEIKQYQNMIEVEDGVLRHKEAGIADQLDKAYGPLIENFRDTVKQAKQKMAKNRLLKNSDPVKQGVSNLAEGLAQSKSDMNTRMAAAAWLSSSLKNLHAGIGTVNDTFDFIDDGLMNTLRYGATKDYPTLLKNGQELHWSAQVNQFLEGTGREVSGDYAKKLNNYQTQAQKLLTDTSDWMTSNLKKRLSARNLKLIKSARGAAGGAAGWTGDKVQAFNNSFNQSVSASSTGQAMMQGMMVYNLSQELPVYWNAMLDDDWEKLGTELFKRRVPFGGAVEKAVMGDYWGVAWEITATVVPPAALLSVTRSLATALAEEHWNTSWNEQLEEFIDELYDNAELEIVGVESTADNIKISEWRLVALNKNGEKFDYQELLQMKKDAVRGMAKCLATSADGKKMLLTNQQRLECKPIEMYDDFFDPHTDSILMENLGKADPWIQLINEMAKNKIVGPKLKYLYFDQRDARFEQIKVDFLQRIKEKLEDRRSGEQALLSGNLPKIYDELLQVAGKLDIRPQVEANLNELFGGEASQFLTSIKDSLVGAVFRGDNDIWDVYKERSAIITKALLTYKQIWDGRKQAEQILTLNHRDQGLRLLTGPYFLTGSAPDDESTAQRWIEYPSLVKYQMLETLIDIKIDAEVDPVALDLSEGAYDQKVLERLTYHGTFKEMWKHVHGHPLAKNEDGSITATTRWLLDMKSANTAETDTAINAVTGEPEESDQDHALKRFAFHEQRVDQILNEFRDHYGFEEEDELTELSQLRDRAIQLANEICADTASASAHMDAIGITTEAAQPAFSKFEKSIQEAVQTARDIESIEKTLTENHQTAEGLAVQIGDDTAVAGARREIVCQAADAMKTCQTNSDRDRLYAEAMAAHVDIKPAFERARANSLDLEGLEGAVKEKLVKLTKAQQMTNQISTLPEELTSAKNAVDKNIAAAEALLLAATETKLPAIKVINDTAEDLSTLLREKFKEKPDDEPLLNKVNVIMGQISAQSENAHGCLEEPKSKLENEKAKAELFLNRYSKLEINLNRIKNIFSVDTEGNPNPLLTSALEKANLADLLISMGGGYIRTCTEHLLLGKVCMNAADQLSTVDFSILMPSVVGMTCQDGANAVATNKIGYQIVSSGLAPHPDWEYCVEATEPAGGAEVSLSEGSTALIGCFEELDIPFYLATVDCSWLPGGTAVYDPGQRIGVCDCINGTVFNSSETRCINCEEYFQAMVGAFNAGDLDTAQAWVDESRQCPWVADAQGQINEERHRRLCAKLMGNIQSACQNGNAQAANGALSEAYSQQCQVDPQLQQWVVSLVNAYNQQVRENQAQQQAQQQHNLQNVINLITQGINAVSQNNQKPSSNNETGGSNSNSSSGSGSNNKSDDGCGGCPPGYMCFLGVCNK